MQSMKPIQTERWVFRWVPTSITAPLPRALGPFNNGPPLALTTPVPAPVSDILSLPCTLWINPPETTSFTDRDNHTQKLPRLRPGEYAKGDVIVSPRLMAQEMGFVLHGICDAASTETGKSIDTYRSVNRRLVGSIS